MPIWQFDHCSSSRSRRGKVWPSWPGLHWDEWKGLGFPGPPLAIVGLAPSGQVCYLRQGQDGYNPTSFAKTGDGVFGKQRWRTAPRRKVDAVTYWTKGEYAQFENALAVDDSFLLASFSIVGEEALSFICENVDYSGPGETAIGWRHYCSPNTLRMYSHAFYVEGNQSYTYKSSIPMRVAFLSFAAWDARVNKTFYRTLGEEAHGNGALAVSDLSIDAPGQYFSGPYYTSDDNLCCPQAPMAIWKGTDAETIIDAAADIEAAMLPTISGVTATRSDVVFGAMADGAVAWNENLAPLAEEGLTIYPAMDGVIEDPCDLETANWTEANCTAEAYPDPTSGLGVGTLAPDGTNYHSLVVQDASAGVDHYVEQTVSVDASSRYVVEAWLKAAGSNDAVIEIIGDGSNGDRVCTVDLATGLAGHSEISFPCEAIGSEGWYRVRCYYDSAADDTEIDIRVHCASKGSDGDGASGVYVWSVQGYKAPWFPPAVPYSTPTVSPAIVSVWSAEVLRRWATQWQGEITFRLPRLAVAWDGYAADDIVPLLCVHDGSSTYVTVALEKQAGGSSWKIACEHSGAPGYVAIGDAFSMTEAWCRMSIRVVPGTVASSVRFQLVDIDNDALLEDFSSDAFGALTMVPAKVYLGAEGDGGGQDFLDVRKVVLR